MITTILIAWAICGLHNFWRDTKSVKALGCEFGDEAPSQFRLLCVNVAFGPLGYLTNPWGK